MFDLIVDSYPAPLIVMEASQIGTRGQEAVAVLDGRARLDGHGVGIRDCEPEVLAWLLLTESGTGRLKHAHHLWSCCIVARLTRH